jgi:hypothetical protein
MNAKFQNSVTQTLSGLIIIKAKALSYDIWALDLI